MSQQIEEKTPILNIEGLKKYFPVRGVFGGLGGVKGYVKAVNDISIILYEGETYGLVGESGCGKSTAGRSVLRLTEPTEGRITYHGQDILQLSGKEMQDVRRDMQLGFKVLYTTF